MKLEIKNVSKYFQGKPAVDRANVTLEGPLICGMLGRNGAGKTTLMNMISGKLFPTKGSICLDGEPLQDNDNALGKVISMGEINYLPEGMKVCELFRHMELLYPGFDRDYADSLSKKFELDTLKKNNKLSTGQSTMMKLILCLASSASVLLLDEPVLGLDAYNRDLLYRELAENYAKNPRLIILSTHLIEEISGLIEWAIIIRSGRIILDDNVDSLLSGSYSVSGPSQAVDSYVSGKEILGTDKLCGLKTVYLRGEPEPGKLPAGLEIGPISLQKLFIEMTNR
jgi:ABC-2 type transport system ATP-binding protein